MSKKGTKNYDNTECIDRKDNFSRVSASLRRSLAFKKLNKKQTDLFLLCQEQKYSKFKPIKDFPDLYEKDDFYLNWKLVSEAEQMYTKYQKTSFYDDIKILIAHGLIKCVVNGKITHMKSVYRMSADWKTWKPDS